jgi:UDP-galactopyranose mutase
MKVLVVGAGFAGATVARELAEAGHQVTVIDQRDHVAGNAHDYTNEHGIVVHKYGPHLWHTSNDEVHEYISRFTEWVPYRHHVNALLPNGQHTPLPVNRETLDDVFGSAIDDWADANGFLAGDQWDGYYVKDGGHAGFLAELQTNHEVTNARQHVENSVGVELCNLFFAPYTKKMWGLELEDLPASVAARIPTNVESGSFDYFPKDKHQYLPLKGYTQLVWNMLDHKNIEVRLDSVYEDGKVWRNGYPLAAEFDHIFTAQPIDTYFGCSLGPLPWRSIKMHTVTLPLPTVLPSPVVNFTHDGPYTRVTEWKNLPVHGSNPYMTTLTFEEPCDYTENGMERYYPVKTSQVDCPNRALYQRYRDMADLLPNVTFIGRAGLYTYVDMHQAISSSLATVRRFIKEHS